MGETQYPKPLFRRTTLFPASCALGLVALVVLLWLWWPRTTEEGADRDAPGAGGAVRDGRETPTVPSRDDRVREHPLWVEIDETTAANPPPYAPQWSTEGRVLVRIADVATTPAAWRVGDRFALSVPQLGETYSAEIEDIDEAVGSRALLGRIAGGDGRLRRYVVTLGPSSVFAYVDTPAGPFELVANLESGWLLPSSSMLAGFDFSRPDYILADDRAVPDGRP